MLNFANRLAKSSSFLKSSRGGYCCLSSQFIQECPGQHFAGKRIDALNGRDRELEFIIQQRFYFDKKDAYRERSLLLRVVMVLNLSLSLSLSPPTSLPLPLAPSITYLIPAQSGQNKNDTIALWEVASNYTFHPVCQNCLRCRP